MLVMMEKTLTLNKSSKVISFNEDRYAHKKNYLLVSRVSKSKSMLII